MVVILQQQESMDHLVKRLRKIRGDSQETEVAPHKHRNVLRTYGLGSQILADLGIRKMRVMGHQIKMPAMSGFGLDAIEYIGAVSPGASGVKVAKIK